ncbi:MAG: hypothetical protein J6Y97_00280 [Prevotella sp.]|nr:hypothetical protein [Prevotella sp.]MBP5507136.1 hypothetical protein [Prevotella sp.]
MKKILFILLLTITFQVVKAGDVIITANDLKWGDDNELVVCMTNENDVNGFQFDLFLPDGCYIMDKEKEEVQPVLSKRLKGMNVMCRALSGGKYRIVVFSMTGVKVVGQEGEIIRFPLKTIEKLSKGNYEVRISNISASVVIDNKMTSTKIPSSSAKIIVGL